MSHRSEYFSILTAMVAAAEEDIPYEILANRAFYLWEAGHKVADENNLDYNSWVILTKEPS